MKRAGGLKEYKGVFYAIENDSGCQRVVRGMAEGGEDYHRGKN